MSLKKLEEELPANNFMRVHRSFIVALDKIQAVEREQILINKERITVADQYKETFALFMSGKSI
jgi:DNA-binding LytR/AlgR family response regulator